MIRTLLSKFHLVKTRLLLLGLLLAGFGGAAQTTLSQGDISIIGFNTNSNQGIAFVTWVPLATGTEIIFSENGYNSGAASTAGGNTNWQKTYGRWTNTSGAPISAGTVITIQRETASTGSFEVYDATGAATPAVLTLSRTLGGHIFAHQGGTLPTVSSASATYDGTILYGLGYQSSSAATTWLSSGSYTSGQSYLPSDLTAGNSIYIASSANGGSYTGTRTGKTISEYKALVSTPSNWTTVGTSGFATYNAASFAIGSAQTITSHPPARSICPGTNTSFSVTATNATSYQWQVDSGSGFSDISNGGGYNGTTTANLSVSSVTLAMDGYRYRCVVGGNSVPAAVSNAGTLSVVGDPVISFQPSNSSVLPGANTFFMANATYATVNQWQVDMGTGFANVSNGGVYSGATTSRLNITGATVAMNGYRYRLVASGVCSSVTASSNEVSLFVGSGQAITQQPVSRDICAGSGTTFSVTAINTTAYRWQASTGSGFSNITDGGVYSGATTATLTITGATAGMNNTSYRCVISGNAADLNSSAAILTVRQTASFTLQPSPVSASPGGTASFKAAASNTNAYRWQVDSGNGTFTDLSDGGPYSGTATDELEVTGVTASMSGYRYRAVVAGCPSEVNSNPALLTVGIEPSITAEPDEATVCPGNTAVFVVGVADATGYQWQVSTGGAFSNITNGGIYSGATTATLSITGTTLAMDGYRYRCVVSGTATPAAVSAEAPLTIERAPSITAQPSSSTINAGAGTSFSATVANQLSLQWEVDKGNGFEPVANGGVYSGATTATLTITGATAAMDGYVYHLTAAGSCGPDAVSASATLQVITTLPVSVKSFTATRDGNRTRITWNTEWERDSERYEVERSTDGGHFTLLAKVTAKGTTGEESSYQLFDAAPASGTTYYRLIQFDRDGKQKDLGMRSVTFQMPVTARVSVFPNPSGGAVNLSIPSGMSGAVKIELTDISGRVLHRETVQVKGQTVHPLNLSKQLPDGQYIIHVRGTDHRESVKLIVGKR